MASIPKSVLREARDIASGASEAHEVLRHRMASIVIITLIVDAIGTLLVYLFEHNAQGTQISTVGDSLFWVSCQLLTVSSQVANPFTTGGRIVDVLLEAYAIIVVTTLAGSWSSFFHHKDRHLHGDR
jgi:hypothetical protein